MRRTLTIAAVLLASVVSATSKVPLRADRIVIVKAKRELTLYFANAPIKTYKIALGRSPVGAKQCEGDNRTPEGTYRVDSRNPNSHYHRALHVSYPNATDIARAKKIGCNPGGDIMIHGITNGFGRLGAAHRRVDWTIGCIAVTDQEIEEIWAAVPNGTAVEIRP
jgi:murein L,D-transpeptidase YafK